MESRIMYQPSTDWITIHISDYHTWQGHISDVPDRFLGRYECEEEAAKAYDEATKPIHQHFHKENTYDK